MNPTPPAVHGHPLTVAAVVGSCALAVGFLVEVSGLMQGADRVLWDLYRQAGFGIGEAPGGQSWWGLLALAAVAYGLALLLLEIPGTPRRLMVSVSFLVLVLVGSPVAALWGVFWSPFVALLGGAWSAFCATLWARHHPMPCEIVIDQPGDGKVISITAETDERGSRRQAGGKG